MRWASARGMSWAFSQVALGAPDLARFPRVRDALAHRIELVLEPGDVLYIPACAAHEIAGGLGQLAIPMLRSRGFEVIASTGRKATLGAHLEALGATEVIDRLDPDTKPLAEQRWAGVVDTVGGATLAAALAQTKYRGALACPGVAGGGELSATVYPLILRGVRLLGVDQTLPWDVDGYPADRARWEAWRKEKLAMWEFCAEHLPPDALALTGGGTIGLDELNEYAPRIIKGEVAGRVVVDVGRRS